MATVRIKVYQNAQSVIQNNQEAFSETQAFDAVIQIMIAKAVLSILIDFPICQCA